MSARSEENKALVRSFFGAVERGDSAVFDQIIARDYNDHLAGQSPGVRTSSSTSGGFVRPSQT